MAESTHRTRGGSKDKESAPKREPKAPPDPMAEKLSRRRDGRQPKPSQPNKTGLPDRLKKGVESLSGVSLDDVKVHRNSSKPAELGALAYAQGSEIHLGAGQEQHLPHEAWHVAQQKQGRVKPTLQAKGVPINEDPALEREADVEGLRALRMPPLAAPGPRLPAAPAPLVVQPLKVMGSKVKSVKLAPFFSGNHVATSNARREAIIGRRKLAKNTTTTEAKWKSAISACATDLQGDGDIQVTVSAIETTRTGQGVYAHANEADLDLTVSLDQVAGTSVRAYHVED